MADRENIARLKAGQRPSRPPRGGRYTPTPPGPALPFVDGGNEKGGPEAA